MNRSTPTFFNDWNHLNSFLLLPVMIFIQKTCRAIYFLLICGFQKMSSVFRRWKNRWHCTNKRTMHQSRMSINENELKTVFEKLVDENRLLKVRFDTLEEKYRRWIDDEQGYLLQRLAKLEDNNEQLTKIHHAYQLQNEKCLQSIIDLIVKMLLAHQGLRKQCIERHHAKKMRQKEESPRRSASCQFFSDSSKNRRYTANEQCLWIHPRLNTVKEQDHNKTNHSAESTNHSTNVASSKAKSEKLLTGSTNKLYFALNNDKSGHENPRSTGIDVVPITVSTNPRRKQQQQPPPIPMTFSKNPHSNHQRLPVPATNRLVPSTKNTPKSTRVSTRSSNTNTRLRPSTVPSTNEAPRLRYTVSKPSEPVRPVGVTTTPRGRQPTTPMKPVNSKTRIPVIVQQTARVSDLDALMLEQQTSTKATIPPPSPVVNHIQRPLFSKDTVKLVRPVRGEDLKIFSSHLIPETSSQMNDSLSTLTAPSLESITDDQALKTSHLPGVPRDFSEDSLNEHSHFQKSLGQNESVNANSKTSVPANSLSNNDISTHSGSLSGTVIKPTVTLPVHRFVFPARLGRLVFYRRIVSEADIYQKICSKDNEINHNVYHLDTIRDYSMEYYMLTTYASDSQLRAWIDSSDDEIVQSVCHLDEDRFQTNEDEKNMNSSDSLVQQEEEGQQLDWCSDLDLLNISSSREQSHYESTSDCSKGSVHNDQSSRSRSSSKERVHPEHTTPLSSDLGDRSESILREILNHSWTDHFPRSNSVPTQEEEQVNPESNENDSRTSLVTDEFQSDFYYLCPITNTTSFPRMDSKMLVHDV